MKFLFTFPVELKEDLSEAMSIEKENFEGKMNKGMMALETKLAERMAKIGLKTELNLSARWDYTFTSDTTMTLDVFSYLDYIVQNLQIIASLGDDMLGKLRLNRYKLGVWKKESTKHQSRLEKAFKAYTDAEPTLKIEAIK